MQCAMSLILLDQFEDAEAEADSEKGDNSVSLADDNGWAETSNGVHVQPPHRLSKWVQRLLNPSLKKNDGDVIIQYPEIIPLNDAIIQDFGRREREYDLALGIAPIEIDRDIADGDDENDVEANRSINCNIDEKKSTAAPNNTHMEKPLSKKVKITNIKYTTTAETMQETLEKEFGLIEHLNLIMKKDNSKDSNNQPLLNSGLAYVTFVDASSAEKCLFNLKSIEDRPVSVVPVTASKSGSSTHKASSRRYWSEVDLSIQCHRCGQMGHMSYECTQTSGGTAALNGASRNARNVRQRKPCPLCANTTDHSEMYQCPFRVVCFNCGIPGHISRECSKRKSYNMKQPVERSLCTLCYAINHHSKSSCPWSARNSNGQVHPRTSAISMNAICASCGRSGHYLCSDLKWFFGLRGVSCSNWYV
jgi:cellular nucleic acid-binding protein